MLMSKFSLYVVANRGVSGGPIAAYIPVWCELANIMDKITRIRMMATLLTIVWIGKE
jgi:hypothetical protein